MYLEENLEETERYQNYLVRYEKYHNLAKELRNKDWSDPEIRKVIIKNIDVLDLIQTEGYWRSTQNKDNFLSIYPWPIENELSDEDLAVFLPKLDCVEDKIVSKKIPGGEFMCFMGFSKCRCCGIINGTSEYVYNGWKWPQGYRHYLVEHRVKPTASFVFFINEAYEKIVSGNTKEVKKTKNK